MALFARICVRVHSRVPAPTFPPPLYTGGWKWAGVRLGVRVYAYAYAYAYARKEGNGTEGRFYLLQGISQGTALPLSQVSFICCKEYPQDAPSYAYAPARLRTHIFPPPYI